MARRKMKRKAFTLIELVVAIGILAMVLSFAGVIFKVSIGAYRTAIANAEIMQKMRAITDQLNNDFKGITKGFPIVVFSNRIVFIANGDFQSIGQYGPLGNEKTVSGNLASIFYGPDANDPNKQPEDRILTRGQMILTADPCVPNLPPSTLGEYCQMPFYKFKAECKNIFVTKFRWAGGDLPPLNLNREQDLVRYMAKGVSDFTIEYERWDDIVGKFDWRRGGGTFVDSDHAIQIHKSPGSRALKFTFTLHDSKDIIKQGGKPGRKFTHIVYIGE